MKKWPRIRSRRTTAVSPWVSLIAREVEFSRGAAPQIYHAVEQPDYISIVALTPAGKIPIVRQVPPRARGLRLGAAGGPRRSRRGPRRGLPARAYGGDRLHGARHPRPWARTPPAPAASTTASIISSSRRASASPAFRRKPGITVKLVSPAEIVRLIKSGVFASQLHIGALLLAELNGFLALPRSARRPRRRARNGRKLK